MITKVQQRIAVLSERLQSARQLERKKTALERQRYEVERNRLLKIKPPNPYEVGQWLLSPTQGAWKVLYMRGYSLTYMLVGLVNLEGWRITRTYSHVSSWKKIESP